MVLKSEMEKQNEELTKKVKRLENKVKKLNSKIEEANSMEEFRIQSQRRLYKETDDLKNKLFEREQQLDAQETKGPIFQVCDPSMQYVHKRRDMGVDIYVERHSSEEKFLLTRIPITFDYFHHKFNTGGQTEEEALHLAATTWPENVPQCCHYSESRRKEKLDESIRPQAHSDIIYDEIKTYGLEPDIVIEAKLKEQAIFNYGKTKTICG